MTQHPITIIDTVRVKGRGRAVYFNQESLPTEPTAGAIVRQGGHEWPVASVERHAIGQRMPTVGVLCRAVFGGPEPQVGEATIQLVGNEATARVAVEDKTT